MFTLYREPGRESKKALAMKEISAVYYFLKYHFKDIKSSIVNFIQKKLSKLTG